MLSRPTLFGRGTFHLFRNPRTAFLQQQPFSRRFPAMADATAQAADGNTSGVTADSLKAALTSKLGAQHVEIQDLSGGCGQAFNAVIVSPQFDKKTMLARHRLVNSALKAEIAAIHAWTPKCYTPEQWEKVKQEGGS